MMMKTVVIVTGKAERRPSTRISKIASAREYPFLTGHLLRNATSKILRVILVKMAPPTIASMIQVRKKYSLAAPQSHRPTLS